MENNVGAGGGGVYLKNILLEIQKHLETLKGQNDVIITITTTTKTTAIYNT